MCEHRANPLEPLGIPPTTPVPTYRTHVRSFVLSVFLFGGNLRCRSLSAGDIKPPLVGEIGFVRSRFYKIESG